MLRNRILAIAAIAVTGLCAACGGTGDPGTPPGPPVPSASASAVAATPPTAVADGAASASVVVTLRSAEGAPVAGRTVALSSSRGAVDAVAPPTTLTDPSGLATFTVRSTSAGVATLTAFDASDAVTVAQTAAVTFVAGSADTGLSLAAASPAAVTADGFETSVVTVTLRDAHGNPADGRTVFLSSSRGATDGISAASGPSDGSGRVSFAVRSTRAGNATFVAFDATDAVTIAQAATVTFEVGPVVPAHVSVTATPASASAGGSVVVSVTLRDATSNPVPWKTVSLASSRGGIDAVSAASGPSDPDGVVTFAVSSTVAGTATLTATDVTDAIPLGQPATVTVRLRDVHRNAAPGRMVTLASSRGAADLVSTASSASDEAGAVTFSVRSLSTGTATLTATDETDGVTLADTPTVTFTHGPASTVRSSVASAPDTVPANGTASAVVTVTLRDANDHPVPGMAVTLWSSRASLDAVSQPSGLSDPSGVVTFDVSSTAAGVAALGAIDVTEGVLVEQTASVTFVPGPASATRSLAAASPASVVADGTEAVVTVTLRDAFDNLVPGKAVALASSRGAADAISAASGLSDPSGAVTFAVSSTTSGAPSFTATDTTDAVVVAQKPTVTFATGPGADSRSTLSATAVVDANGTSASTVTVTLRDAHSNAAAGKTITLASSRGATDVIAPPSAVTGASGVATFAVRSSAMGTSTFTARDETDGVALTQTGSTTFRAFQLFFATQPPATTTAGVAFATPPAVGVRDAAGNADPAFAGTVFVQLTSTGGLRGTTIVRAVAGTATFPGLSLLTAATGYTLSAWDPPDGLASATSDPFAVTPADPARTAFVIQPSNSGAGIDPTLQVAIQDAFGNQTSASGWTVNVAIGNNPGGGTLTGTTSATSRNGHAWFTGLGISARGNGYTLVASGPGLGGSTSAAFDVKAPLLIGSGTAASCTDAAVATALGAGGYYRFNCGLAPVTITFATTKDVGKNVALEGWSGPVTLSGAGARSLFRVASGATLALRDLTITRGASTGSGGAIVNEGALSVTRCTVSDSSAATQSCSWTSGGNGGAIANFGTAVVASSTFSGNDAYAYNPLFCTAGNGGAIYSDGLYTAGRLVVTNCTFSANTATAVYAGASTSGNGGAIFVRSGTAHVWSSTFAGNDAWCEGDPTDGTYGRGDSLYGSASLHNALFAGYGWHCAGPFLDGGNNLDPRGSCGAGAARDPLLDPSGLTTANGGPTATIALQPTSPAIDAGDPAACAAAPVLAVDQRGKLRPGTGATSCSIGAFEHAGR